MTHKALYYPTQSYLPPSLFQLLGLWNNSLQNVEAQNNDSLLVVIWAGLTLFTSVPLGICTQQPVTAIKWLWKFLASYSTFHILQNRELLFPQSIKKKWASLSLGQFVPFAQLEPIPGAREMSHVDWLKTTMGRTHPGAGNERSATQTAELLVHTGSRKP